MKSKVLLIALGLVSGASLVAADQKAPAPAPTPPTKRPDPELCCDPADADAAKPDPNKNPAKPTSPPVKKG